MSKLGAKKKRTATFTSPDSTAEWFVFTGPREPEPPKPPPDVWTEEQARAACMICLLLMLLSDLSPHAWYMQCVTQSCAAPQGSYRNVFWWSLRYMRTKNESLAEVSDYFKWKTSCVEPTGWIRRDAIW